MKIKDFIRGGREADYMATMKEWKPSKEFFEVMKLPYRKK